jgi:hypothetical protein
MQHALGRKPSPQAFESITDQTVAKRVLCADLFPVKPKPSGTLIPAPQLSSLLVSQLELVEASFLSLGFRCGVLVDQLPDMRKLVPPGRFAEVIARFAVVTEIVEKAQ